MARLDTVPDAPLRQRKGKGKGKKSKSTPDDPVPFIRPSEITGSSGKPLVDLSLDDLRAAGVSFTEAEGEAAVPGLEGLEGVRIPRVVVNPEQEGYDSAEEEEGEDGRTESERALEAWWDEFFDSMVYTIPFSFLFLLLDM